MFNPLYVCIYTNKSERNAITYVITISISTKVATTIGRSDGFQVHSHKDSTDDDDDGDDDNEEAGTTIFRGRQDPKTRHELHVAIQSSMPGNAAASNISPVVIPSLQNQENRGYRSNSGLLQCTAPQTAASLGPSMRR